jgi:hypothetical protein
MVGNLAKVVASTQSIDLPAADVSGETAHLQHMKLAFAAAPRIIFSCTIVTWLGALDAFILLSAVLRVI